MEDVGKIQKYFKNYYYKVDPAISYQRIVIDGALLPEFNIEGELEMEGKAAILLDRIEHLSSSYILAGSLAGWLSFV